MIREIILTALLSPYLGSIWNLLGYLGMLIFSFILFFYLVAFKKVKSSTISDPLADSLSWLKKLQSLRPSSDNNCLGAFSISSDNNGTNDIKRGGIGIGIGLRKQYDFLTRNGLLSDGLNIVNPSTPTVTPTAVREVTVKPDSILLKQLSLVLKEFFFNILLKKNSNLAVISSSWIKAILNCRNDSSRNIADPINSSSDQEIIKEELLDPLTLQIYDLYQSFAGSQLYELIWLNALAVFDQHIQIYKEMRKDYILQKPDESLKSHLDDFNEYSAESEDDSLKWSLDVDKVNQQILVRLDMSGKLHPAVLKGNNQDELSHLRTLFNDMLAFLEKKNIYIPRMMQDKFIKIIVREASVCQFMHPLICRVASPLNINQYILDSATRRIVIQKAIKSFRTALETNFSAFPPVFLISNYQAKRYSILEKIKYVDLVTKYSKRATSGIDISTVRHEIIKEVKRKSEQLSGVEPFDQEESNPDTVKKYVRALQILKSRLEKKLKVLSASEHFADGLYKTHFSHIHSPLKTPTLSIQDILDDYYKSQHEQGPMISLSLYYFLDYLESRKDFLKSINLLRFCFTSEKYRQMVWRINTGITIEQTAKPTQYAETLPITTPSSLSDSQEKIQSFSLETHSRFRKEVSKIYQKFIAQDKYNLGIPKVVVDSFKRYILPPDAVTLNPAKRDDDYLCVMNAQRSVLHQLDDLFNDFIHSEGYFRWVRDYQKLKLLNFNLTIDNEQNHLYLFEGSALMNSLENELMESCMKLTGQKQQTGDLHDTSTSIIVLEDDGTLLDVTALSGSTSMLASPSAKDEEDEDEVHAPGELFNNSSKIYQIHQNMDRLLQEIDRINFLKWKVSVSASQSSLYSDPLYTMQIHVLDQTKDQLVQEIGELVRQKAKYESQEQREALLPGQCHVSIQQVEQDDDPAPLGKKVVYFLIEIDQKHLNTGWAVKRRYNDFDALHRKLREKFPIVDDFDFPSKSNPIWAMVRNEVKGNRMKALEMYLQRLIDNKDISKSEHLRNFLSSNYTPQVNRKLFNFADVEATNNSLKATQAKLTETLNRFTSKPKPEASPIASKVISFLDLRRKSFEDDINASHRFGSQSMLDDDSSSVQSEPDDLDDEPDCGSAVIKASGPLMNSLARIALQLFDFKGNNEWILMNAGFYLIDSLLGSKGSPESFLNDLKNDTISEENIASFLKRYKDILINPTRFTSKPSTTTSLRIDAKIKLHTAVSEMFSKTLAEDVSARNLALFLEMMQNERLNRHIIYTQLDSLIDLIKNVL